MVPTPGPTGCLAAVIGCALLGCLNGASHVRDDGPSPALAEVSAPTSLRPCCAFGDRLGVSIVGIPLPVRVDNVVSLSDLGRHHYDGGVVFVGGSLREGFVQLSNDGMAYTCRGEHTRAAVHYFGHSRSSRHDRSPASDDGRW